MGAKLEGLQLGSRDEVVMVGEGKRGKIWIANEGRIQEIRGV